MKNSTAKIDKVVVEKRELTNEEIKALQEKYKKTHPEGIDRVSGCCDNAKNYLT